MVVGKGGKGICNGTRLIVDTLYSHMIKARRLMVSLYDKMATKSRLIVN